MRKWLRRLLLLTATLMLVLLGGVMLAFYLARSSPGFYQLPALTEQERAAAAASAEEKFIRIQNHAARIGAAELAAARHERSANGVLPNARTEPVTIEFSDTELNSFFDKWSRFQDWKSTYQSYFSDPEIILKDGRLILAATLKNPNLVVSLHFEPKIDEQGQLRLELTRILGGRLPLPEAVIRNQERKLASHLLRELPAWQDSARISSDGAANSSSICAAMTKLLAHTLRHEPAEPVLFLPVLGQSGSVPVKILKTQVGDGTIALTVQPMSQLEQANLLSRIRENTPAMAELEPGAQ